MNLQEFVTQTIIAIVNGVADAKTKLGEDRVNPMIEAFSPKNNSADSVRLMEMCIRDSTKNGQLNINDTVMM